MPETVNPRPDAGWRARLDRFAAERPDWVLLAPYMSYLLLLALRELLPYETQPLTSVIRGVGALLVVWLVWRHLPALGRPHWPLAIAAGILSAAGWVAGQKLFSAFGLPVGLPFLFDASPEVINPHDKLGVGGLFWSAVVTRIAVAVITVPIVEELFWRGFLLRAFINWSEFERVPLGTFTWLSFVGTALLSTIQHPYNWGVSIVCWLAWNGLMYWKKSLLFLMITHGVTNLVLYIYVVYAGDWAFW